MSKKTGIRKKSGRLDWKKKPKLAIRYARRIMKEGEGKTPAEIAPGTRVYELVEELAKYLPEEVKSRYII